METEQITLAPSAGSGIGKKLFDRLLAEPDFLDLLVAAAREGLTAMCPRRWDKESEGWVTDPDAKTRVATLFGLLAQAEGQPVNRVLHQHIGAGASIDPLAEMQRSPALLEAARKLVDKAEYKHSGHQAHKKPRGAKPEQAAELVEPTPPAGAF